jgi:serine/threonine protein kinase
VLGSGGFGEVVLARHDISGIQVAIKYLRRGVLDDRQFAEMFRAEARVLASLQDPHVVRLYEYIETPAGAAIVMELVDGVSLRQILSRQGRTSAEAALVVLQGSLLGLAAAHQRGVVHRDYKPENVLVGGDGVSKLTDFGIAARTGERALPAGTLAYAPPEQLAGGPATPATDVYAATATFYECLIGRPPFAGDTAEALLWQHTSQPVPLEPVPVPLRPMVAAGMAKNPAARPPDAASFVAGLNAAAAGAYGPDWENRGRSHLAEAALLLAALWPSGSAPAVAGHAVQHVGLSGGGQPSQNYQPTQNYQPSQNAQPSQPYQGQPSQVSPESEHARHLEHVRHLEHLKHLRRLRLALTGVGAVVVAAAVALVVIAPWKSPPPVLKPTGLVVDASTTSSVAIRWAGPATGPEPTVYKILRNGHVVAQVPGTTTYFRETGLPPATSFRFQVFAIRGNKKGPRSSVLTVTTVTPPVSAAVLAETWSVHWKVLSASSNANAKVGQTWNDSWNFTPACPAATCNVTVNGSLNGDTFAAASLARAGAGYSGNTTVGGSCSGSGGKINFTDTMRIQVQVQDAKVQGGTWTATSWTGSVTLHIPAASNATLNCSAATVQMNISGTP